MKLITESMECILFNPFLFSVPLAKKVITKIRCRQGNPYDGLDEEPEPETSVFDPRHQNITD